MIRHISIEGPGTIGMFFRDRGHTIKTIELDRGEGLPDGLSGAKLLIVLGGPMNAYEEDRHPFLKDEDIFLKKAMDKKIPILGICLGAQLLAKACGANIRKAENKEIGWYKAALTSEGTKDPLFNGLDREFDVFQWHEDTFEIPDGGELLVTSSSCKNQAFRFSENFYGLQFHIEVGDKEIADWAREYRQPEAKLKEMLLGYDKVKEKFSRQANIIYTNLTGLIGM